MKARTLKMSVSCIRKTHVPEIDCFDSDHDFDSTELQKCIANDLNIVFLQTKDQNYDLMNLA